MEQFEMMMQWEEGTLSEDDTVTLFQALIDEGTVWTLQGCYGRQAMALIENGDCHSRISHA